ncbi:MAG: 3-phosphoshikimate 1-carboxyvinyltransferase [Selenomonadaceae bacterium]|nr:3-phosphoshikimate 1-carboxyvinyltransferase [Selenomonadaceae bacterium]
MKKIRAQTSGLTGEIMVPGDKSISHRSVMLSGLADTPVYIRNFLRGADCLSTIDCMRAMGVTVEEIGETELKVTGRGLYGLRAPSRVLDAGNSGTTLRLLLGLTAAQPFSVTFTGDKSLQKRPMGRVLKPLTAMGASFSSQEGRLPITVQGQTEPLQSIYYEMPVASAQVKSAILLAGLYASGDTVVTEPYPSRDHTERMLAAFGVPIMRHHNAVKVRPIGELMAPEDITVPGDISSAAYWLVAGSLIYGSNILLKNVGVNPTRSGILDVLKHMGANIDILNRHTESGEEVADIRVRRARLKGTTFGAGIMPRLIDEVPIIAVAAVFAHGDTIIEGAGELRVKETDRLVAIKNEFNKLSPGSVELKGDGLVIHGGLPLQRAECATYDDHRMAMALSIFGAAGDGVYLDRPDCVDISYPAFYETLKRLGR